MPKTKKSNRWAVVRFVEDKKLYITEISKITVGRKSTEFKPKDLKDYSTRATYWVLYNNENDIIYSGNLYECQILQLFDKKEEAVSYFEQYSNENKACLTNKRVIVPPIRLDEDDSSIEVETPRVRDLAAIEKEQKKAKRNATKSAKDNLNRRILDSICANNSLKNDTTKTGEPSSLNNSRPSNKAIREEDTPCTNTNKKENLLKETISDENKLLKLEVDTLKKVNHELENDNHMLHNQIKDGENKYIKVLETLYETYEKCTGIVAFFTGILGASASQQEKGSVSDQIGITAKLLHHENVFKETFKAYSSLNKKLGGDCLSEDDLDECPVRLHPDKRGRKRLISEEDDTPMVQDEKKAKILDSTAKSQHPDICHSSNQDRDLVTPTSETRLIDKDETMGCYNNIFDISEEDPEIVSQVPIKQDNLISFKKMDITPISKKLNFGSNKKEDKVEENIIPPDIYDNDDQPSDLFSENTTKEAARNNDETVADDAAINIFDVESSVSSTSSSSKNTNLLINKSPIKINKKPKSKDKGKRKESMIQDSYYPHEAEIKAFPDMLSENEAGKVHIGYNTYITSSQWQVLKNKASAADPDSDRRFLNDVTRMLWGDKICRRSLTGTVSPKFATQKPKQQATPTKVKATANLLKMKWKKQGKTEEDCKKNLMKVVASVYGPRSSESKKRTLHRIKLGKAIDFIPDPDDDLSDLKAVYPEMTIIIPTLIEEEK